jgi:hypothetical protein
LEAVNSTLSKGLFPSRLPACGEISREKRPRKISGEEKSERDLFEIVTDSRQLVVSLVVDVDKVSNLGGC